MQKRRKRASPAVVPAASRARPYSNSRAAWWLALAACVLYGSTWRYGFAGDDSMVISNNLWTQRGLSALPEIVSHSLYFGAVPLNGGLYRPLAGAYYVVVGALGGLHHPAVYHLFQILLYGLNAAIVFWFFTRLVPGSFAVPVVAAGLFVVHPIHTEVVCNIKSADELLCLIFLLTSATAWLLYADTSVWWWRGVSVAAYAMAVCSKETAVPMVVAFPALWYFFRRREARTSLLAGLPFLGVALVYLGLRHVVLGGEPPTPIVTALNNALLATNDRAVQIASALAFLGRYARMLVWPWPLSFDYSYNAIPLSTFADPRVWLTIALGAGLGIAGFIGIRRRRVWSFAILWGAASIVLVSNLFFLVSTNFGERLLYLPSVMVCYVAANALIKAGRGIDNGTLVPVLRAPMVAVPLLVAVSLAGVAVTHRVQQWSDQETLFAADVQTYPNSARLNDFAGSLHYFAAERRFAREGMVADAMDDFTKAAVYLTRAIAIRGSFLDLDAPLGLAEFRLGDYATAIPHLEQAMAFTAYRSQALETMAESYEQLQMPARAIPLFQQIDAEGLQYPPAWFALGSDAAAKGDDAASIQYYKKFLEAQPNNMAAYFNLGKEENRQGDYGGSLSSAEHCVALKPAARVEADCRLLAADDLVRTGRRAEAMAEFEKARAIDPTNPLIRR